jgi:hypothetical protein
VSSGTPNLGDDVRVLEEPFVLGQFDRDQRDLPLAVVVDSLTGATSGHAKERIENLICATITSLSL